MNIININFIIFFFLFGWCNLVSSYILPYIKSSYHSNICSYNKPLKIHIDGGGNTGPYLLGILGYIKKNFDISNSIYSGVSAGSYISIISIFQNDLSDFEKLWKLYISNDKNFNIPIYKFHILPKTLSNNIIKNHKNEFNFKNINLKIYISQINKNYKTNLIYYDKYYSFEDLLKICECSSYLPYLSGSTFAKKYKNNLYIDGVFTLKKNEIKHNDLIINKYMWNRIILPHNYLFCNYNNYKKLYDLGWKDTEKNHNILIEKFKSFNK